jgi:hypothetical protein
MVMPELVRWKGFVLAKCLRQRKPFWFFLGTKRTEKNPCDIIAAPTTKERKMNIVHKIYFPYFLKNVFRFSKVVHLINNSMDKYPLFPHPSRVKPALHLEAIVKMIYVWCTQKITFFIKRFSSTIL